MMKTSDMPPAGGSAPGQGALCWRRAIAASFPCTVPVLTGYLVLGAAYGVLMQSKGFGAPWVLLMSAVAFCGSMQFAAITLLTSAFDPLGAFIMSVMVNARHLFFSLALLPKYRALGGLRYFLIYTLSDETFSITCSAEPPEGVDKGWFMFFITLLDQIYWVASAAMGAALGSVLPFSTEGVDFVMTAMFVVIFLNQWEKEKQHASAIIGIAAPLVCLRIFGSGSFLIPSMVCILVALLLLRRPIEAKESEAAK